MRIDRLTEKLLNQAKKLLSYIPFSPCLCTQELLMADMRLDRLEEFMVLLNLVENYLGIVIAREPLEAYNPDEYPNDVRPHYWVAMGRMNRARVENMVAPILAREDKVTPRV